jgi:hypothetical protein
MIDLKCCTVLVNNKAEYIALIKEAQKQGYTWADGTALTNIFCDSQQDYALMESVKYIIILPPIIIIVITSARK